MRLMNWAVTRDDGESQREITMRKVNMIWGGIVCLALTERPSVEVGVGGGASW